MPLDLLSFDFSEADDGSGTFDALASVAPRHLPALEAEAARVLDWAQREFPDGPGPLDEGASWDLSLQASTERSTPERLRWDAAAHRFERAIAGPDTLRHTLALSLAGSAAFCAAFREAFVDGAQD